MAKPVKFSGKAKPLSKTARKKARRKTGGMTTPEWRHHKATGAIGGS